MKLSYCVFIRAYCDIIDRDYWVFMLSKPTELEALAEVKRLVEVEGDTCKIEKVYYRSEYPNL